MSDERNYIFMEIPLDLAEKVDIERLREEFRNSNIPILDEFRKPNCSLCIKVPQGVILRKYFNTKFFSVFGEKVLEIPNEENEIFFSLPLLSKRSAEVARPVENSYDKDLFDNATVTINFPDQSVEVPYNDLVTSIAARIQDMNNGRG